MLISSYTPNTILTPLDPHNPSGLQYGDFGAIWGVYKPPKLASTPGNQLSIIDILISEYIHIPIISHANDVFGVSEELGMLTRLDNETSGMLWFAHDKLTKELWLSSQLSGNIIKIYEADVLGRLNEPIRISTPIMHHRYDDTRMITITHNTDTSLGRGSIHQVVTTINPGAISHNITHVQVLIHKGCRHQIRIHCSSIGNPIIGDQLYHKQHLDNYLHLRSIGVDWKHLQQPIIIDYRQFCS